ncbi:hypothetical protein EDB85DRAFT_2295070, partial [Lactarius pseudohatsudake]
SHYACTASVYYDLILHALQYVLRGPLVESTNNGSLQTQDFLRTCTQHLDIPPTDNPTIPYDSVTPVPPALHIIATSTTLPPTSRPSVAVYDAQ